MKNYPRIAHLTLVLSALLAAAQGPAWAAQAASSISDLLVQPGVSIELGALDAGDQAQATAALDAFSSATGSRWQALDYAAGSLTPRLVVGSGLDMGRPVYDSATAEELARDLIATYPELFGASNDRLELWQASEASGKQAVHFWEVIDGMPVLGTKVTSIFTESGVLAAFGAATYPMIESADRPVLSKEAAALAAHRHLASQNVIAPDLSDTRYEVTGPYVLPVVVTDGAPAPGTSGIEGRTILRVLMSSDAPVAVWHVDVDATSGEVLQRMNRLFHVDFTGTVTADLEDPDYCEGSAVQSLPEVEVRIDGVGSAVTGPDGSFSIPNAGTDPAGYEVTLHGPFIQVFNADGAEGVLSGIATPGLPLDVLWSDSDAREDERDVFFHTNETHQMLKDTNPSWVDMDFRMPANVNINQSCNAFYSFADSSTNYFREQLPDGCGNTGRMGDVIAHEYGHGITHQMYDENQPGILHEGNSDITAIMLFARPEIGRGFFDLTDCGTPLRNADNELHWPEDSNGNSYNDGQIMAAFYWDALLNLTATHGAEAALEISRDAWHNGRLLVLPQTIPEQVLSAFIANDDNGNLDDGTPDFDDYCSAALERGFDCPQTFTDVVVKHAPLLYGATSPGGHRIVAEIYSLLGNLDPAETSVHWRPSGVGAFSTEPFVPFDGNNQEAFIPTQPVSSNVDYFIVGTDEFGNTLQRPENGFYTFQVVTHYFNGEEGDAGWTVGDPGDTATQGIWERIDPVEQIVGQRPSQPEDDASPDPGAFAWITGQLSGSPAQHDVNGTTSLLSPVYDVSGTAWVYVQFMRWFQTLVGALGAMEFSVSHDAGPWIPIFTLSGTQPGDIWEPFGRLVAEPIGGYGTMQFKLVVIGAANPSIDEGGLDEFVLIASDTGSPSSAPEDGTISAVSLALSSPNPSSGAVGLQAALPKAGMAQLSIYGVDGRRIRSLLRGHLDAGTHRVDWDGRDESGRTVGSGVYFIRLSTGAGVDTRRVVIGR